MFASAVDARLHETPPAFRPGRVRVEVNLENWRRYRLIFLEGIHADNELGFVLNVELSLIGCVLNPR